MMSNFELTNQITNKFSLIQAMDILKYKSHQDKFGYIYIYIFLKGFESIHILLITKC